MHVSSSQWHILHKITVVIQLFLRNHKHILSSSPSLPTGLHLQSVTVANTLICHHTGKYHIAVTVFILSK